MNQYQHVPSYRDKTASDNSRHQRIRMFPVAIFGQVKKSVLDTVYYVPSPFIDDKSTRIVLRTDRSTTANNYQFIRTTQIKAFKHHSISHVVPCSHDLRPSFPQLVSQIAAFNLLT